MRKYFAFVPYLNLLVKRRKQSVPVSPKMSATTEETYAKKAEESPEKSPTSILDVIDTKKVTELTIDDESFSEGENPDEPSEYVTTIAEEGKEDTYSEDSETIIFDVESECSTESDEYEFFTCDDGEGQTSQECDLNAITDSNESNEEMEIYEVDDSGKLIKTVDESIETLFDGEETNKEISILDTKLIGTNLEQSPNVTSIENSEIQQSTEKKTLPSIIVHENIDVKKIKYSPLRERISLLADSFYTSMRKGEFSMNRSIECCAKEDDKTEEEIENHKKAKESRLSRNSSTAEISKSNEDEAELYKVHDSEEMIKNVEESIEALFDGEETIEEVSIPETKLASSLEQSSLFENPKIQQSTEKKKLPSIDKDAPLREPISLLADSFYISMRKGEFSMNRSIECCAKEDDKTEEEIENHKKAKESRLSRNSSTAEISKSNEDEAELYKVDDSEEMIKNVEESIEALFDGEETIEEVSIPETKLASSLEQSSLFENAEIQQSTEKKKLPSIDKDAPLREPILLLAESFYTSMRKGDISMNPSIECCAKEDDKTEKKTENHKRAKKRKRSRSSSSSTAVISKSVDSENNVNVEKEHIEEKTSKKRGKKQKLSKSTDNLDQIETKSKPKKTNREKKVDRLDNLIEKLLKDIKNEWIVKPSTNMDNSWITEVAHTKTSTSGSTSTIDKKKKAACKTEVSQVKPSTSDLHNKGKGYKTGKVHSKDFRSPILNSDPSRVQRIKTKALLKKKGKG